MKPKENNLDVKKIQMALAKPFFFYFSSISKTFYFSFPSDLKWPEVK
jgi:hypothetical protein